MSERVEWAHLNSSETVTSDIDLLQRRFRAFEGIPNGESFRIESGLDRLCLFAAGNLAACNETTLARARNREFTGKRWAESFGEANGQLHVRQIASPTYAPTGLSWRDTLQWLSASAVASGGVAAARKLSTIPNFHSIGAAGMAVSGVALLAMAPKLIKAIWLFVRNGSLEGSLAQVAWAVMDAMNAAGLLVGSAKDVRIQVRHDVSGRVDLIMEGLGRAGERAVLQAVTEVLGPVGNPRYLLVRQTWPWLRTRCDYHAVPAAFAAHKESAEAFHKAWLRYVGSSRLVYTRNPEGRLTLLRARARSFAAGFQRRVDRRRNGRELFVGVSKDR